MAEKPSGDREEQEARHGVKQQDRFEEPQVVQRKFKAARGVESRKEKQDGEAESRRGRARKNTLLDVLRAH